MDYSLVIGVDSAKQELVVGIVGKSLALSFSSLRIADRDILFESDFIRTYTWNKRIESWVKETTFIGSAFF